MGGLFCLLANMWVVRSAKRKIVWPNQLKAHTVDCIIVPGARVYEDGTPCTILKDRLDTAIDLYRAGISQRLLLSGDHGTVGYDDIGYGAFSADQVQACYLTTIALTTGDVMSADECMRRFIK